MIPSFHTADRRTYRRVAAAGFICCAAFVIISFWLRPQADNPPALAKADRLLRTAGEARHAN